MARQFFSHRKSSVRANFSLLVVVVVGVPPVFCLGNKRGPGCREDFFMMYAYKYMMYRNR